MMAFIVLRRILNDSQKSDVALMHHPHIIALGCLFLASFFREQKDPNYDKAYLFIFIAFLLHKDDGFPLQGASSVRVAQQSQCRPRTSRRSRSGSPPLSLPLFGAHFE